MSRLLETIKINRRQICNLEYHNRRFNDARQRLFGRTDILDLGDLIEIPAKLDNGIYKCRLIYDDRIHSIEFFLHTPRIIRSLKLVRSDEIDYSFKYSNRKSLELLLDQKDGSDDIIIIKNGFITDTSFSNILFQEAGGRWITPNTPLLNGTMRQYLLDTGLIRAVQVKQEDIVQFERARLVNCMMGMDEACDVLTDRILK